MNKARRGELRTRLPTGLCYDARDQVALHPDRQVQEVLGVFFKTYRRTGSAMAVVKWFREQGLLFPRALINGPNRGRIDWSPLAHSRAVNTLRNPRYAGAYVFGRTKARKHVDGSMHIRSKPMDEWDVVIPDAHPGYITWQEYNDNLKTLQACAKAHGTDRRDHPPGEGPALLQGMVVCGVCGGRMTVGYHRRNGKTVPDYTCQRESTQYGTKSCQTMNGGNIDRVIGELLLELVEPMTLDLSMHVQHEVQTRLEEADAIRRQSVDRARYQADLARERFMNVDPRNRLVADQLEADWNEKLRLATQAQRQYEEQREKDRLSLNDTARKRIRALAKDFPRVWNDSSTNDKQRKRMARLLIEDATLTRMPEHARVQIRFRGGQTRILEVPLSLTAWQMRKTPPDTIAEIDQLLEHCTDGEVARQLNQRGIKAAMGGKFKPLIIFKLRKSHGLASLYDRLRSSGLLTQGEMADELGVCVQTIRVWYKYGFIKGYKYNDRGERLYALPDESNRPVKQQGQKLTDREAIPEVSSQAANEVQHEA